MAEHGGYRQPANPAPPGSSGPGAFSKRTDTGPKQTISTVTGQAYGDAGQQHADQAIAPMAGQEPLPPMPGLETGGPNPGERQQQMLPPGDFAGPSNRPDEPITSGTDIGPGPGTDALTLPGGQPAQPATGAMTRMLANMSATDTSGALAALYAAAQKRGV